MNNKNSILIAGCGYIGKKIALKLLTDKIQHSNTVLTALVSNEQSLSTCHQLNIDSTVMNLDDEIKYTNHLNKPSKTIIYLIPPQPQGQTDLRMTAFLKLIQHPPEKFILISTTGVYGDCQGNWINEFSPVKPTADRAKRRLSAENQLLSYCKAHHVQALILRVAGLYAADKLPVKRLLSGEPILREQDSGYSNRIHADDLTQICLTAISSDHLQGLYNCTDGHPSSMCDYFIRVAKALNLPVPAQIDMSQATASLSSGMLSYLIESKRIDNKKLLADLGRPLLYPDLSAGLQEINTDLHT